MVTTFRGWSYDQRLRSLNRCTLEERRSRDDMIGDMMEVFKLLNGFDVVAPNTFFNSSFTGLRGHEFKLYKNGFCTNLGTFSFSNTIVQDWNSLPQHVVLSNTVNTFLNSLDQHYVHCRGFI